jgi:hypothetical protein
MADGADVPDLFVKPHLASHTVVYQSSFIQQKIHILLKMMMTELDSFVPKDGVRKD